MFFLPVLLAIYNPKPIPLICLAAWRETKEYG
jgi:hypothetical protein